MKKLLLLPLFSLAMLIGLTAFAEDAIPEDELTEPEEGLSCMPLSPLLAAVEGGR